MSALRRWGQTLGLIAFGIGLALVIGVLALLLVGDVSLFGGLFTPCESVGDDWLQLAYGLLTDYRDPCVDFYWPELEGGEFHTLVRHNNIGMHDDIVSIEKPDDVYRIVLIGDSFAQGWQVPLEKGFPWLLEQILNEGARRPVEIINLSVDGYGTDRELLLYSAFGWRFEPDLVLLAFYAGNDIQNNHPGLVRRRFGYDSGRAFFSLDESGGLQLHNVPRLDPAAHPGSMTWRWLVDMTRQPPGELVFSEPERPFVVNQNPYELEYPINLGMYLEPEEPAWREAWAVTEALLLQFREVVNSAGINFGVIVIPDRRVVHSAAWDETLAYYPVAEGTDPLAPVDRVTSFLEAHNVPTLNLTYALRGYALSNPEIPLYFGYDGHFTATGHEIAAQRIDFWLEEMNFVP
jgi:hypothetical protein